MRNNYFLWVVLGAACVGAFAADSVNGKALYDAQCLSCHGVAGASNVPSQPILSAQYAEYIAAQLHDYRDGSRNNAIMSPLAANLSDDDIADLSAYLSAQQPVIAGAVNLSLAQSGEKLYRGGNIELGIAACAACHGPTGAGILPHYPRLSGQYAEYIAATLREYAANTRQSDKSRGAAMNSIAAKLSEEQINALAAYISGLAP